VRVVERVASIDRFRLETKIGKKACKWREILKGWLSPRQAKIQPAAKDRAGDGPRVAHVASGPTGATGRPETT
jgi:hypothetical protein